MTTVYLELALFNLIVIIRNLLFELLLCSIYSIHVDNTQSRMQKN